MFWKLIAENMNICIDSTEIINFKESINRVLAKDIHSPEDLPPFTRSTVDGFAVRAIDTAGASSSLPVYLKVTGKIAMGSKTNISIASGEVVKIATGGMMPAGADAVIMVEYTEYLDDHTIETGSAVAAGENVVWKGEDIKKGELLLSSGHLLRPQDVGVLAGLGIIDVKVYKKPEVAIISSGDELISPESEPDMGQIRDINSYALGATVQKNGENTRYIGIIKDSFSRLQEAVKNSLTSDLVLISGGSSVGLKDMTIDVLNSLGKPGVLLHGISIKPGKPTILAVIDNTPVIGLPGHPASSWTISYNLVRPLIMALGGRDIGVEDNSNYSCNVNFSSKIIKAKLERNLVSDKGREQYVPVKLIFKEKFKDDIKYIARPITGKSSLITTLVEADGFIKIGTYREGLSRGEEIKVIVF